ncbi:MAG TPA: preprotein translocase subunit SecG [Allosphingosinicella sp.]|nr:preprotein translocase subunit SecG [Allosphingosinicella sp.]
MFTFLLIVQTIVAASLVIVILMQRSEGGGLGVGGNSSGLMSARGAADFLTRATAVLATLFVILSIALAGLAAVDRAPANIDTSLAKGAPGAPATAPGQVPLTTPGAIPGITPAAPAPQDGTPVTNSIAPQMPTPVPEANGQVPLAQ